jgi:hypothetical protein
MMVAMVPCAFAPVLCVAQSRNSHCLVEVRRYFVARPVVFAGIDLANRAQYLCIVDFISPVIALMVYREIEHYQAAPHKYPFP